MSYRKNFQLADDMINHLNTVIYNITDPFITSRYVGFVSVAAVTVYELAIKEIFYEFSTKKQKIFGSFVQSYFRRINGRIKTKMIRENYIPRFGDKYVRRFKRKIDEAERRIFNSQRKSIKSCYNNVIVWRNQFTHQGEIPSTPTYQEVIESYEVGKEIIRCLAETMRY